VRRPGSKRTVETQELINLKPIAQEGRPFTDEEFVKICLMSMTEELFPEKKRCVKDASLSVRTVTRRIDDIGDFTL
jgi:hypothetical protein